MLAACSVVVLVPRDDWDGAGSCGPGEATEEESLDGGPLFLQENVNACTIYMQQKY